MATTRILTLADIAAIVDRVGLDELLDNVIARLTKAFADDDPEVIDTIARTGFHYSKPDHGLIEWMPAVEIGRRVSMKMVGYHPTNPSERRTPTVIATTSLYDTVDGRLLLLCEATFLTALRTGATSAVVTDILAVRDATTLGLIGCGTQAVTQAHAISRVRDLERIVAYDANPEVGATLGRRIGRAGLGVPVEVAERPEQVLAEASILCTATSVEPGAGPVVADGPHRPSLHVNAVGADDPGKTELPVDLVERALVVPDVVEQCLVEGESQHVPRDRLGPSLPELVRHRRRYEAFRSDLTVFDSTGWALADLVVAEMMLEHAELFGVGLQVDLHPVPDDPYDPYDFLCT